MKRNLLAMLVVAGGLGSNLFGQQYPQQYPQRDEPYYQSDPYYDNQGGYDQAGYGQGGVYAPAPPPMPRYAYNRPPMPGPGFYWVDGYWNRVGPRYVWVNGFWGRPPYAGGYWVAPRYTGGRFFLGFWGGGGSNYNRGFVQSYRPDYRFKGNNGRGNAYGRRR